MWNKRREHEVWMSMNKLCLTWVDAPCPLLSVDLHSWHLFLGHPWIQRVHRQKYGRRCHPSLVHPHLLPATPVLHSGRTIPSFQGWSALRRQSLFLWTVVWGNRKTRVSFLEQIKTVSSKKWQKWCNRTTSKQTASNLCENHSSSSWPAKTVVHLSPQLE